MSQKTAKRLRKMQDNITRIHSECRLASLGLSRIETERRKYQEREDKNMGFAFKCKYCGVKSHTRRRWFVRCIVCNRVHIRVSGR